MAGHSSFLLLVLLASWAAQNLAAQPVVKKPVKPAAPARSAPPEKVLVVVNGQKITDSDLNRLLLTRRVPEAMRDELRRPFLEQLIDARLIGAYLAARDTNATKEQLDEQLERVRQSAEKRGTDSKQALSDLGYTDESLKSDFSLPLAWKRHVDRAITAKRIQEQFETHRAEFDGTQVRASQIFIKVASDGSNEEAKKAEEKLRQLKSEILQKNLTFAEAARMHSEGPSREKGGDVGWFPYRGKMPEDFSRIAFGLKPGEISEPFRSRFGVHLCTVTDRKPGELSLEDARDEVLSQLSADLWKKTVADLRANAKIEWKTKLESSDSAKPATTAQPKPAPAR